ncbi:TonB-dependent receptor [Pedobacter sp. BAL39]|uniref:TonB-dependent receptor n=1 Tax=Pedobacter sp. BAL39 TaxID=391596 RepID=UPI0002FC8D5B|nr:TonB-dependent receptor [Pedobacter sp. BAL39]
MKLILAFWLLSINVAFSSVSYGQNIRLSLDFKNKKTAEILHEIERQSEYHFFYNAKLVDVDRTVTIKAVKKPVLAILDELFANSDATYKVIEKDIILTPKKGKTRSSDNAEQQQRTISGEVRDQITGQTIPGVGIMVKGTTSRTVSNEDGKYTIAVPSGGETLVFTYIGYTTQEEFIGDRKVINLTIKSEVLDMNEVVVIGYGTVKRANLGGAVATIDAKTFESRPVRNAAIALQGAAPGLTITRNGGAPGSSPTIRVRDISSINGGSPLVLIDGAEGDMNLINPADIESISVLKDGTAAIYGARAAEGVILITTKNGRRNQDLKISLDAFYAIKTPALLKKPASLYEHASMALEITDGSFPYEYTQEELQLILDGSNTVIPASKWGRWSGYPKFYKDQNWNDMVIGNGSLQNYNLGLSGGGEKYSYLISLGAPSEQGLPKFGIDNDKRYYVRAKTNIELRKNLIYDLNLSYEASNRRYASVLEHGQSVWDLIYKTRSWAPMHNPAGNFYTFEGFDNPAQVLEAGGDSQLIKGNFTINNQLSWKINKDFNLTGRAVIRKNDGDNYIVQKMIYNYNWDNVNHRTARKPNSAERSYTKNLYKNFTAYADYKKTLGKHDIAIMAGAANESSDYDRFWAKRINFDQQESMPLKLGSPQNQDASGEGNAWTINSFFSRINYAFANKYLIEGTLRADGSSRFAPSERWGYFPGANATWRVGEESFIKKMNVFDDLKFRASYGEMGNQSGIGPYDYIELITIGSTYYPFGNGERGQLATQSNLVSKARTWETIISKNIGADFSLFNNRLFGSFDYFWKTNKNMLIPVSYPSMLGIAAPSTNSGRLEIKGWELALGWRSQVGEFKYSVRANISDAKNKVASRVGNNLITLGRNATPLGYSTNSYFGYEFDGIIQTQQELADYRARFPNEGIIQSEVKIGDAKYKDLDGDGRLSVLGNGTAGAGDARYLGDANPRYNFGLNLGAEYKGFDFSAFIQGVGQRTMFLEGDASMPFAQAWFQSASYWYGKTWTPERTDAKYPAITMTGKRSYNYYVSSNTKHNVAYVRMKNLQVGYTVPQKMTQKLKIDKIRVYFSGEDLFEIHNAPGGWDPEENGSFVTYPFTRHYSFGASIVF